MMGRIHEDRAEDFDGTYKPPARFDSMLDTSSLALP